MTYAVDLPEVLLVADLSMYYLSIYLSTYLLRYPPISLSVYLSPEASAGLALLDMAALEASHLSGYPSILLSSYLSIYLSFSLSLSIHPSTDLFLHLLVYLFELSIYLSIYRSIHLYIYLSIYLPSLHLSMRTYSPPSAAYLVPSTPAIQLAAFLSAYI